MNEIGVFELDARGLAHPEPLERSVEILRMLDSSSCFHLVIHRYPQPLLMIAERLEIGFEVCEAGDNEWHILFCKKNGPDPKELMRRYCGV
ncbi:hypothetical protein NNO_0563 [Hydrogenimonas sp.]|nr:hypothetical protein NNO_0563 [Hydrogenimonas sp.]